MSVWRFRVSPFLTKNSVDATFPYPLLRHYYKRMFQFVSFRDIDVKALFIIDSNRTESADSMLLPFHKMVRETFLVLFTWQLKFCKLFEWFNNEKFCCSFRVSFQDGVTIKRSHLISTIFLLVVAAQNISNLATFTVPGCKKSFYFYVEVLPSQKRACFKFQKTCYESQLLRFYIFSGSEVFKKWAAKYFSRTVWERHVWCTCFSE